MKRRVKLKEIASSMGISAATVSLALNDRGGISPETKRMVLEKVQSLESEQQAHPSGEFVKLILYTATVHLENYENKKLFNISYVEISRLLQHEQIEVRLVSISDERELLSAILSSEEEGAMGILLEANEVPLSFLPKLEACRIPLILYDNELVGTNWDVVSFHNKKAVYQGLQYLESNGHSDIVYLSNSVSINNFDVRRKSFARYMNEHHANGKVPEIVTVGSELDTISESVMSYLSTRDRMPDALFLENFTVALGTLMAVQRLGLTIPDDISLIGIDALPESPMQSIQLTHFVVPHRERSKLVVRQLLYRLDEGKNSPSVETLVSPQLVIGQTVKKKRG